MNGERKWRCDGIHTICKFEAEFLQSGAEQSQVRHSGKKIGNSFQLLISMSRYLLSSSTHFMAKRPQRVL